MEGLRGRGRKKTARILAWNRPRRLPYGASVLRLERAAGGRFPRRCGRQSRRLAGVPGLEVQAQRQAHALLQVVVAAVRAVAATQREFRGQLLGEAQGRALQVALRGVALQGEAVGRQAGEGHPDVLGVVGVFALHRHFAEQLGLLAERVLALQAGAETAGVALLLVERQRGGSVALVVAVHLHPRPVGADEGRQVPGLAALGDVVADPPAEGERVPWAISGSRVASQGADSTE